MIYYCSRLMWDISIFGDTRVEGCIYMLHEHTREVLG
jgi:hypothetical protein